MPTPSDGTGSLARVVRVDRPARHFTLLRAQTGDYLGTADGATLTTFGFVDDRAIWRSKTPRKFEHVISGLSVDVRRDANSNTCRVLSGGERFGQGSGHTAAFSVDHGPARLPSEYLLALRQNGWVCLAAVLDAVLVGALTDLALAGNGRGRKDVDGAAPMHTYPVVAKSAAEPVSLWLMRQYLRTDDIRFAHAPSLAVLDRDDGRCDVQGWHTDFPYLWGSPAGLGGDRVPPGPSGRLILGMQRNVCISDFTRANGATRFKLGSHASGEGPPAAWGVDADYAQPGYRIRHGLPYEGDDTEVIEAPAGSIILYDARTWHRAGLNRTGHRRAAMLQAVTPMYVMPFKDTSAAFDAYLASAVPQQLNARERREVAQLMVHRIVGPLGHQAIGVHT